MNTMPDKTLNDFEAIPSRYARVFSITKEIYNVVFLVIPRFREWDIMKFYKVREPDFGVFLGVGIVIGMATEPGRGRAIIIDHFVPRDKVIGV
jgi:hypothetical protein